MAAAIEQNHDAAGIIWPNALAPFQLVICPINYHKSDEVRQTADRLYQNCLDRGIEVLLDDRGLRPGVMFSEMELIGIPHRVILSDRGLKARQVEYKGRCDEAAREFPLTDLPAFIDQLLKE